MSQNSSDKADATPSVKPKRSYNWKLVVGLPLLVLVGFAVAQLIVAVTLEGLDLLGVSLGGINSSVLDTLVAACVYVLTLVLVIGVPWLVRKYRITNEDIGLARLVSWMDIGLAPVGYVVYLLAAAILVYAASQILPGFDMNEIQPVGFESLVQRYEYILAFVTLVIVAPVAEEILFRGYLYGKLRRAVPIWVAILITSVLFGFIHGQWNVGVDVFALSIVMCILREITGSIWAGMILHILKNGLAFYLLFINPTLLNTIGG